MRSNNFRSWIDNGFAKPTHHERIVDGSLPSFAFLMGFAADPFVLSLSKDKRAPFEEKRRGTGGWRAVAENVSITLRLFAVFRETLGSSTLTHEVPAGTTVGQVLDRLIAEYPALAGAEAAVSFSVNRSYASADTVLRAGDEVAFIPPVSGGASCLNWRPVHAPGRSAKTPSP